MSKREIRVLLIKSFKIKSWNAVIYIIIRGVLGIEHVGLRLFKRKNEIISELKAKHLLDEVRITIDLDKSDLNNVLINNKLLRDTLINTVNIINNLIKELNKLITSNN